MNDEANAHVSCWKALMNNCLLSIMNEGRFNRVLTVLKATSMVLQLGLDIKIWSATTAKLERLAEKRQQEEVQLKGHHIIETIVMRKVHIFILRSIEKLGKRWYDKVSMSELRSWAVFGLRGMIAARPQDPECLLSGIEIFSDTDWSDSKSVGLRFLNTKETNSKRMDKETERNRVDRKRGLMSALITIHRPVPHPSLPLPDYFAIIFHYDRRRGTSPLSPTSKVNITVNGKLLQFNLPSFFLGTGKNYCTKPVSRSTISGETLRLLKKSGAVSEHSPLKAEHIRHSALSQVEEHDKSRLWQAIGRARNSMATYASKYRTPVAPEQRRALDLLPTTAQLELVMLG